MIRIQFHGILRRAYEARFIEPILNDTPVATYEEIRVRLGKRTEGQVAGIVARAKKRFEKIQREVVRELAVCKDELEVSKELSGIQAILHRPNIGKELSDRLRAAAARDVQLEAGESMDPATIMPTEFRAESVDADPLARELNGLLTASFDQWDQHVAQQAAAEPVVPRCLADIVRLHGPSETPKPSIHLLNAIKRVGKAGVTKSTDGFSSGTARVIYCAAIACGVVRYGTAARASISRMPDAKIANNLASLLNNPTLPNEFRSLFREALDSLRNS